jgi:SagB-type dehydrogenase family enzyme
MAGEGLAWAAVAVCGLLVAVACTPPPMAERKAAASTSRPSEAIIPLPSPDLEGGLSLEETLARRRSLREFSDATLSLSEIGQLLWAAQGMTSDKGYRTAPSAGALYPLEVYVASDQGLYHYQPRGHQVAQRSLAGWRSALCAAALNQEPVCQAPAVFIIASVVERTAEKYGERAEQYVHLEAGHAAQNLLLQAVSLGLGAVPIGAFDDEEVRVALGLPANQAPLYLIAVGRPTDK